MLRYDKFRKWFNPIIRKLLGLEKVIPPKQPHPAPPQPSQPLIPDYDTIYVSKKALDTFGIDKIDNIPYFFMTRVVCSNYMPDNVLVLSKNNKMVAIVHVGEKECTIT